MGIQIMWLVMPLIILLVSQEILTENTIKNQKLDKQQQKNVNTPLGASELRQGY